MNSLCWLLSLCFSCCSSCCFSWCSCSLLRCSILNYPPPYTHTFILQQFLLHLILHNLKYVCVLDSLPWFVGAVAAGRRRCRAERRMGRGVKAGAEGWGAPCPNQGASPVLPPWGPWETRLHTTLARPPRNLGKDRGEGRERTEASIYLIPTKSGWFTKYSVGNPTWKTLIICKQWQN